MLKHSLKSQCRPPGFVEGCCTVLHSCRNIFGSCHQSVEFCIDSATVAPGDVIKFEIRTNANWCNMPYYNCRNGVQNSYCGPLTFVYTQPDPPVWEGSCVADEVYQMLIADYRLNGILDIYVSDTGCLVLTARDQCTRFEIIVDTAVTSGFVPTVTELVAHSDAERIPYGHIVVNATTECHDGECVVKLPDADHLEIVGVAARCRQLNESCGHGVNRSAQAKVKERYYYNPNEDVSILTSGGIWVPSMTAPGYLSDRLVVDFTGVNGIVMPIPYSDPTPTGMIDLDATIKQYNPDCNLLLINL